jgi:hypothetical protein
VVEKRERIQPDYVVLILRVILSSCLFVYLAVGPSALAASPDLSFVGGEPPPAQILPSGDFLSSQVVAGGVTVSSSNLSLGAGEQRFSLLRIDLSNPDIHLGVVQAHQHLFNPGETLSSMASRSGAVAGINGDFFEIRGSGAPIGAVSIDGELWQSPAPFAVLGVTSFGRLTIGPEAFVGSVTADQVSYPWRSVNRVGDLRGDQLVLFTARLGAAVPAGGATVAMLQPIRQRPGVFTVQSIQAQSKQVPILQKQGLALAGKGSAGAWLAAHLRAGKMLTLAGQLEPDHDLMQAIGGGPIIIKDGVAYRDPRVPAPNEATHENPLSAIGITQDGKEALLVVCDGRQPRSRGLTYSQMTSYLLKQGMYQAMIFDSGGSSELVARLPGDDDVSVINSPSDGRERPVANGLFVYSADDE